MTTPQPDTELAKAIENLQMYYDTTPISGEFIATFQTIFSAAKRLADVERERDEAVTVSNIRLEKITELSNKLTLANERAEGLSDYVAHSERCHNHHGHKCSCGLAELLASEQPTDNKV